MTAATHARAANIACAGLAAALAIAGGCHEPRPALAEAQAGLVEPCDPLAPIELACAPPFDQCAFDFRLCDADPASPTGWSWQAADCRTRTDEDGPGLCPARDGFVAACEAAGDVDACSVTECVYWTDTDHDGVSNEVEVTTGSDPGDADSDDDGCLDGHELDFGSDPLDPDSDDDGLGDCYEDALETDPHDPDSDDDELTDEEEIAIGTDPLQADSDADLLLDGDELEQGTDPHDPDTDGDGWADGVEVQAGTDPLDPASHPEELPPLPDGGTDEPGDAGAPDPDPLDAGVPEPPDPEPTPLDGGVRQPFPDDPDPLPVPGRMPGHDA